MSWKRLIKKIVLIAAAVAVLLFTVIGSSAENLNITSEISEMRSYYVRRNTDCSSFEENLACAAAGVITYIPVSPYLSEESSAAGMAMNILTNAGFDLPQDAEKINALKSMQNEDGSFGSLEDTILAVAALKSTSTVFGSEDAVQFLLSAQNEDGSFGDGTSAETARVLSVINIFSKDAVVASAMEKAVGFLKDDLTEDGFFDDGSSEALSYVIMGLCDVGQMPASDEWGNLFAALNQFKNEDITYKNFAEDDEPSEKATALALCAMHALGSMHSPVKQLMTDGEFSKVNLSDYAPFFIGYGILAALSVVFWIYIFARKKNSRTLAEAKEAMLKKTM